MPHLFSFLGGESGTWRVLSIRPVIGDALAPVSHIRVVPTTNAMEEQAAVWSLHGQISNIRYATRTELGAMRSRQQVLGRPAARRAAFIPIKKSAAWWDLAQDERRAIFEETSHHTSIGLQYLPAVARQLYHARDLGEPFDFLTWFEYADADAEAFEDLVTRLRETREWHFVEREIDIRLERED